MMTVGGDAYIASRANVGIGPYEHRINRPINRNLNISIIIVPRGFFVNAIDSAIGLW